MNIRLCKMTRELYRSFRKEFTYDPDLFMDMSHFQTYEYSEKASDAAYERQSNLKRVHLAVMRSDEVIGDIILKNLDYSNHHCTLSIHLKNDSVKNQGYGTQAEILALEYAFDKLGMETVYADAIIKNKRSQHVLTKVGFVETHNDETFHYYRCDKTAWAKPLLQEYHEKA